MPKQTGSGTNRKKPRVIHLSYENPLRGQPALNDAVIQAMGEQELFELVSFGQVTSGRWAGSRFGSLPMSEMTTLLEALLGGQGIDVHLIHRSPASIGAKPDYVRRPVPKRRSAPVAVAPLENDTWVLCFKREFQNGRQAIQTLHVIDGATHRTLGVDAAASIRAIHVIRFLRQMIDQNGRPQAIRCENHIELGNKAFTDWCLEQCILLVFAPPGGPD